MELKSIFTAVAVAAAAVAVTAACVAAVAIAAPVAVAVGSAVVSSAAVASAATTVAIEAAGVAVTATVAAAACDKIEKRNRRTYSVYFLQDGNKQIQYVGRVTDDGYKARMAYHEKTRGLTPAYRVSGLSREEARGLEEIGMIECHTLNAMNPVNNKIHGVGEKNSSGAKYMKAAVNYLVNRAEDKLLNLLY